MRIQKWVLFAFAQIRLRKCIYKHLEINIIGVWLLFFDLYIVAHLPIRLTTHRYDLSPTKITYTTVTQTSQGFVNFYPKDTRPYTTDIVWWPIFITYTLSVKQTEHKHITEN